jgi:hypothetical protein
MTSLEFVAGVKAHLEAIAGNPGPFNLVMMNDAPLDGKSYATLVVVWEGITNDNVTKVCYRYWLNSSNVITRARIAKTEWPAGI